MNIKIAPLDGAYILSQYVNAAVFESVGSTNTVIREYAEGGSCDGFAVIASEQTEGRGRGEHSFISPPTGVYLSLLIRPDTVKPDPAKITATAAVAAAEAITEVTSREARIKWVNDIYTGGKKVCGILAESAHYGTDRCYIVLGVGFNVYAEENGFPGILAAKAGTLYRYGDENAPKNARECIALSFITRMRGYIATQYSGIADKYDRLLFIKGMKVGFGGKIGTVIGIDGDFRLIVKTESDIYKLDSGEISVTLPPDIGQ